MTQAAQVGAVYQTSQELLDADLPHLAVVLDARGYAIQRDGDGNWYSVSSVSTSDLVGAYTLVHLPADPLPTTSGSVTITESGTPFMRRWDAVGDSHSRPERWIGPDGVTVTDADLRGFGIARTWDAGAADGGSRNGRSRSGYSHNGESHNGQSHNGESHHGNGQSYTGESRDGRPSTPSPARTRAEQHRPRH